MELSTIKFELNLLNDTDETKDALKAIFLIDNIVLDDVRRTNKDPIR